MHDCPKNCFAPPACNLPWTHRTDRVIGQITVIRPNSQQNNMQKKIKLTAFVWKVFFLFVKWEKGLFRYFIDIWSDTKPLSSCRLKWLSACEKKKSLTDWGKLTTNDYWCQVFALNLSLNYATPAESVVFSSSSHAEQHHGGEGCECTCALVKYYLKKKKRHTDSKQQWLS